jgi:DNA-binding Lrp family transcriptional regulator
MDNGYIRVIGELDPVVVGSGPVLHAWIRVADGRQSEVAQHLAQWAQTQVVMATTGEFDIFTEINLPSVEALSDMVVRELPLVPGVRQVQTQVVLRSFRRASRWRIDGSVPTEPVLAGPVSLSADEMRLLGALTLDGRASLGVLAETCGVSEPKVQRMLSGLVDSNALTFRVELEPLLVGYGVEAIVSLQTRPGAAEGIAQELAKDEHTRCLFGTSGGSQLFWHVLCRDIHDLWTVSTARMGSLDGIISCETNTVVRAYKRAGRVRRGLMVE